MDKEILNSKPEEQRQLVDDQNIISTIVSSGNNPSKYTLSRKMFCYNWMKNWFYYIINMNVFNLLK